MESGKSQEDKGEAACQGVEEANYELCSQFCLEIAMWMCKRQTLRHQWANKVCYRLFE